MTDGAMSIEKDGPPAATDGLPLEIRILEMFGAGLMIVGPTDVERLLGVSKGVASPRLRRLAEAGYLVGVGSGRYQLGPSAARLYIRYMACQLHAVDHAQKLIASVLGPIRDMVIELTNIAPAGQADFQTQTNPEEEVEP